MAENGRKTRKELLDGIRENPDNKPKCMTPECGGISKARGLCLNCYNRAKFLVKNGDTTWEELQDMKLCLPSSPRKSAFIKAFESKMRAD